MFEHSQPDAVFESASGLLTKLFERGVVASFDWRWPRPGEPLFLHTHASVSPPDEAVAQGAPKLILAGGTALEPGIALAKGISEAVERYCASRTDQLSRCRASAEELGQGAATPEDFNLFLPGQRDVAHFPYATVTRHTPLTWVEAVALDGSAGWLPAAVVDLYSPTAEPHDFFEAAPVSGYACGSSWEDAALRGLLEVIERDAFMTAWRLNRETACVTGAVLKDDCVRRSLARFHPVPGRISCHELTNDLGWPVVLAAFEPMSRWPVVVIATACAMTLMEAAAKAVEELAANFILVQEHLLSGTPIPTRPAEIRAMEDHGLFYADPARRAGLNRLLGRKWSECLNTASFERAASLQAKLAACREKLSDAGLKAWVVDLTRPEVADLGFHVVKVVVPGAYPIEFGSEIPRLGGRRLRHLAERWELPSPECPKDFNLAPHPFP